MRIIFDTPADQEEFKKQLFDFQTSNSKKKVDPIKLAEFLELLFYSAEKK